MSDDAEHDRRESERGSADEQDANASLLHEPKVRGAVNEDYVSKQDRPDHGDASVSRRGTWDDQTELMVQGSVAGAWLVLLDDDDAVLDRLVAVFASEHEARDFVAEVAGQFDGSLEYGFYRHGWRFDAGNSRYAAP